MKTTIKFAMIFCMLISSKAIAQFGFGVEAAMTTSSVKITELKDHFTDAVNGNNVKGFEGGIFMRAGLGPLYVKPKLLIDYQGGTLSYNADGNDRNVNFKAGKIVVPILVGFKFLPPVLSVEAGPVYNRFIFVTDDFNGNAVTLEPGGWGYRAGLNAKLSIIDATVSYQGIKNNGSALSTSTYQLPDQVIFGLGIEF